MPDARTTKREGTGIGRADTPDLAVRIGDTRHPVGRGREATKRDGEVDNGGIRRLKRGEAARHNRHRRPGKTDASKEYEIGSVGIWGVIPILRGEAEKILRNNLKWVEFRWMEGRIKNVIIGESAEGAAFSDGSRQEGHTAAATTRDARYLGTMATVMDAEMLGIAIGWSNFTNAATDSKGGIGRTMEMKAKSWIEELVVKMQATEEREIAWVKGHSGIPGNGYAGYKAKEAPYIGSSTHQRQLCTPAGTRQEFHTSRLTKQVKAWNRNALQGLTYMETDKDHPRAGFTR